MTSRLIATNTSSLCTHPTWTLEPIDKLCKLNSELVKNADSVSSMKKFLYGVGGDSAKNFRI